MTNEVNDQEVADKLDEHIGFTITVNDSSSEGIYDLLGEPQSGGHNYITGQHMTLFPLWVVRKARPKNKGIVLLRMSR